MDSTRHPIREVLKIEKGGLSRHRWSLHITIPSVDTGHRATTSLKRTSFTYNRIPQQRSNTTDPDTPQTAAIRQRAIFTCIANDPRLLLRGDSHQHPLPLDAQPLDHRAIATVAVRLAQNWIPYGKFYVHVIGDLIVSNRWMGGENGLYIGQLLPHFSAVLVVRATSMYFFLSSIPQTRATTTKRIKTLNSGQSLFS